MTVFSSGVLCCFLWVVCRLDYFCEVVTSRDLLCATRDGRNDARENSRKNPACNLPSPNKFSVLHAGNITEYMLWDTSNKSDRSSTSSTVWCKVIVFYIPPYFSDFLFFRIFLYSTPLFYPYTLFSHLTHLHTSIHPHIHS